MSKSTLTEKRKVFAREFIKTSSPSKAAYKAYNVKDANSASSVGAEALKQPAVKREIERLMDEMDLTDDVLVKKMKEGLDARVIANYKGEAHETEIPDMKTRHKYIETVKDIKGHAAPKKIDQRNLNLDVEVEKMGMEELMKQIQEQTKLLKQAMINEESDF